MQHSAPFVSKVDDVMDTYSLAQEVLTAARAAGLSLATAESLTGGLVAGALTAVPGSSDVVRGGVVSYQIPIKAAVLGVSADVFADNGPGVVSDECAKQMASGARELMSASIAVSLTGIAGPGGAEPGKPVGTVYIGIASQKGVSAQRFEFSGTRSQVRQACVRAALKLIYEEIVKLSEV